MPVRQVQEEYYVIDYSGKVRETNRWACENLGYSREELLNLSIDQVDIEVDSERHRERFWKALGPGEHVAFEGTHRRKDGSTFPVEVRLNRLDIGADRFFLGLARDVGEQKKGTQELRWSLPRTWALKEGPETENLLLPEYTKVRHSHEEIVGESDKIQSVLTAAKQVAGTQSTVLILGETGTGKELLASYVHKLSARRDRPIAKVSCAALPSTLIEAELFGHEKGAFTGAAARRIGRFEFVDGGTIFLDELGDLPSEVQAKLLRVLQEGEFQRIGSSQVIHVNVRVIAATNKDLARAVREGTFREDLYYRLNVFPISMPPLRDRTEDIPQLVCAFVEEFGEAMGKSVSQIARSTMERLQRYPWPGNIRELRNVVERAMIWADGPVFPEVELPAVGNASLLSWPLSLRDVERDQILATLERTDWRVSGPHGAARLLDINPKTLESRMKKLGICRPGSRTLSIAST